MWALTFETDILQKNNQLGKDRSHTLKKSPIRKGHVQTKSYSLYKLGDKETQEILFRFFPHFRDRTGFSQTPPQGEFVYTCSKLPHFDFSQ